MFSVQSYELHFPGLFLAAPISDMKKDLGALKACPFYSPLRIAPIKNITFPDKSCLQNILRAWLLPAQQSRAQGLLLEPATGRIREVVALHIFIYLFICTHIQKESGKSHGGAALRCTKVHFFLEAESSHRPCLRDPLKAVGHGAGILELLPPKSHCLLFPERALGLQTPPLLFPVTDLECSGALLSSFRSDKNTPTHP